MLVYFFLILAAVCFLFISFARPVWSLYLVTLLLPTYLIRFNIGFIPFTFLETMVLLLALSVVITKKVNWQKIYRDKLFWPIIAVLAAATLAVFTSYAPINGAGIWKAYFVEPVIFYWLMISLVSHRRELEGFFWALGGSVIYLSLVAIWQKIFAIGVPAAFLNDTGGVDRVVSVFGYPNAIGLFFGPILVVFVGFLFYRNQDSLLLYLSNASRFWFKLLVVVLGFGTMVLAKSEGAILAVLVCSWLIFFTNKKTRMLSLAAAGVFGLMLLFDYSLREFVASKLLLMDWSGQVRQAIWSETWAMLKDNWLFGAGLSGYQTAILPYHAKWFEVFPYPHNIFLNGWSELGLPGLLAFAWLGLSFIWLNLKNVFCIVYEKGKNLPFDKIASFIFLLAGLEILIHGLVDAPYFKNDLSMLFWVLIGSASLNSALKPGKND